MIRWTLGVVAALWLWLGVPAHAQNQERIERSQATRFQDMVVRVLPRNLDGTVANSQGFGLIVGTRGSNLIIATPRHVVWGDPDNPPTPPYSGKPFVRFVADKSTDLEGTRYSRSLNPGDLALIEVPKPDGMTPLPVPILSEDDLKDQYVYAIGVGETWRISPLGGSFNESDPYNDEMRFSGLATVPGSSGGAIVTARGVAAMILRSSGSETHALPLWRIQKVFKDWQREANLLTLASGEQKEPQLPSVTPPPSPFPAAGSEIRDCDTCPVMVLLPPGDFTMGATSKEEEDENVPAHQRGRANPPHKVTIAQPFYMAKYAVTRGEYAAFIREMGERPDQNGCWNYGPDSDNTWKWIKKPRANWRDPGFGALSNPDRQPVVCVSYDDARAYVEWLRRKSGRPGYDLPSEAQWEYAARAVRSAVTPSPARYWGTGQACDHENVADAALARKMGWNASDAISFFQCDDKYPFTAPVGSFRANGFGLYDMLGNVWQWTEDCWHADYKASPPVDGSAWNKTGECGRRVGRGAAWYYDPGSVRAGRRDWNNTDNRNTNSGFRVARTLLPP